MRFPTRMAFLAPIWFLGALAIPFIGAAVANRDFDAPDLGLIIASSVAGILVPLFWVHGIYRAVRLARFGHDRPTAGEWSFWIAEAGLVLMAIAWLVIAREPVGLLGGVGTTLFVVSLVAYFVSLWRAAAALSAFEEGGSGRAPLGRSVVTFLAMIYWAIGVWFMQGRLNRLRGATEAPRPMATAA